MRSFWILIIIFQLYHSSLIGQSEDSIVIAFQKKIDTAPTDSLYVSATIELNTYILNEKFTEITPQLLELKEKLAQIDSYKKHHHQVRVNQQLAIISRRKADYSQAISYYLEALEVIEKTKDFTNVSPTYFNIGVVFYELKDYKKAAHYFKKCVDIGEKEPISNSLANAYNRLGLTYRNMKLLDSAIYYYEKAGTVYNTLGNEKGYYKLLNNMGSIHTKRKNYKKALALKLKSLAYYTQLNEHESTAILHYSIAVNYGKIENYKRALYHINQSIDLAEQNGLNERRKKGYNRRSQIYRNLGNYDEAFLDQKRYTALLDSLNRVNKSQEIQSMLTSHEIEKQKIADSLQLANQKKLVVKELEKQKATEIRNYVIMGVLALILVMLYLYNKKRLAYIRLKNDVLEQKIQKQEATIEVKEDVIIDLVQESIQQLQSRKQLTSEIENLADGDYSQHDIKTILLSLKAENKDTDQLLLFRKLLQKEDADFKIRLQKRYPDLTPGEVEMAHYSLLQLSLKEIAALRGVTIDSVKKTRYRLRKKLGLTRQDNLSNYISDI